jgi:hypothetical protein
MPLDSDSEMAWLFHGSFPPAAFPPTPRSHPRYAVRTVDDEMMRSIGEAFRR